MNPDQEQKNQKRVLAGRMNGALGGFKTAANHSQEWLDNRAKKGGDALLERYSIEYYRWINSQRRVRRGWPLGKLRKAVEPVLEELQQERKNGELDETVIGYLEGMLTSVPR